MKPCADFRNSARKLSLAARVEQENFLWDAMAAAADLHIGGMLGPVVAHDQRNARDAFITDDAHFDAVIFGIHRHNGRDADLEEIGVGDGLARHLDDLTLFQGDRLKMGTDLIPILKRYLLQKPVAKSGACVRSNIQPARSRNQPPSRFPQRP